MANHEHPTSTSRLTSFLHAAGLVHSSAAAHFGLTPSAEYYKASNDGAPIPHTDAYSYGSETYYIDSKKSKYAGHYGKSTILEGTDKQPAVTQTNSLHQRESTESYHDRHGTARNTSSSDPASEKHLVRKNDLCLLPILFTLLFFSVLSRNNVIYARTQGMDTDLGDDEHDNDLANIVFTISSIVFAVPSTLLTRIVAPSTWLAVLAFCWGILSIGQGFIQNFGQLYACRFLTGMFEAGFWPGAVYLISMYYPRYRVLQRLAVVFSGAILARAVGGLFASGLAQLDGHNGLAGWRFIFIVQGGMTAGFAIIAKFILLDRPEQTSAISEDEKVILATRLAHENGEAMMNRLDVAALVRIVADWKIYAGVLAILGSSTAVISTPLFLPTLNADMGYEGETAYTHALPTYAVAFALLTLFAYASDRLRHRCVFALSSLAIAFTGTMLLVFQSNLAEGAKYFASFLVVAGGLVAQPIVIAWLLDCTVGSWKQGISIAAQIGFGNLGGLFAGTLFTKGDKPEYKTGYSTLAGLIGLSILSCVALYIGNTVENARRARGGRDDRRNGEDADNLGDDHPDFVLGR